jgi:hypothetical protein
MNQCGAVALSDGPAEFQDVAYHAVNEIVFDDLRALMLLYRSTQHAREVQQSGASASQAIGTVVIADEFALRAEHGVVQAEKSDVSGAKMWHASEISLSLKFENSCDCQNSGSGVHHVSSRSGSFLASNQQSAVSKFVNPVWLNAEC